MSTANRAKEIVNAQLKLKDIIVSHSEDEYSVASLTTDDRYLVNKYSDAGIKKWKCDCRSFTYRTGVSDDGSCKHILAMLYCKDEGVELKTLDEVIEEGLNDG